MKQLIILSFFALFCVVISAKIQALDLNSFDNFKNFIQSIDSQDRLCIENLRTKEKICDQELLEKLFTAYCIRGKKKSENPGVQEKSLEPNPNRKLPYLKLDLPDSEDQEHAKATTPQPIEPHASQSSLSFPFR